MKKLDHSLFFIDNIRGGRVRFSPEELRHALLALRMDAQAKLRCTDGEGRLYTCVQTAQTAASGEALIMEEKQSQRPLPYSELYIGLPDRDPFEESLAHLAALGAARIIPIICRNCQTKWWERWDTHADRMRRKMIAGIKQSINPWLPRLMQPQTFAQALDAAAIIEARQRLVADSGGMPLRRAIQAFAGAQRAACFIGPPGGFSEEEISALRSAGCTLVNLSPYRLRTELAAVVMCASVMQSR